MRRLVLSAFALSALSLGSLGAPANATGKFRVVKFTDTTVATPAMLTGSPQCDPVGNCVLSYTNTIQVSGDLQGTATEDGMLYSKVGSSTFQFTILAVFTGSV